MVDWPAQPSLPVGMPYGWVTPPTYGDISGMASPYSAQQIEALRIKFQEALMQIIVLAVNGFFDAGEKAFDQLSAWATQIAGAANSAADLIADLLDSLLGTGHTISDLVDYFQAISEDAGNAIAQLGELITGLGGDVMADAVEVITMIRDSIAGFIALVTGAVDLDDVAVAINTGVTSATDVAGFLAATGQASLAALGGLIQDLIDFLTAIPANLLSGALPTGVTLSGTPIGDLLQFLSPAGLYDAAQGFTNQATSLLKHLTPTGGNVGQFDAAYLQGTLNNALQIGSAAVSSIFNGSGQFIGQINAAATGTLNGAIQLGGTALSTLATNWNAAVTNVTNLIGGVTGASTAADVATNINLAATNIAQIGTAAQNAAAGIVGSLNVAATQVQTAFSGVINSLVGGLFGIPAPANQTQAQATTALANVTTNVVGNAASVIALQNQIASQANLLRVVTKFSDYGGGANPLGSKFTVSNDATVPGTGAGGGIEVVDGRAVYKVSGSGFSANIARYNVAPTVTDYQEISWVHTGAYTGSGVTSYARAYCRMNSAATSFFRITVGPTGVDFHTVVAGSVTPLGAFGDLKQGARYTVKMGELANIQKIFFYENETLLSSFVDTVHQYGASYRYAGFGINGNNAGGNGSTAFNLFSVADQLFQPGPPAAAYVSTSQATTSTTYADLATTTDTVTVDVGSSGMALVNISAQLLNNAQNYSYVGFAISGASTVAATDAMCMQFAGFTVIALQSMGSPFVVTGLAAGSTTFKMKYKAASGSTATFANRRISVIPL